MNELTVGHLFDWHNRNVVITGADNMLGTALAHAFAYYRAEVILIDENLESMHNIQRIITGMGKTCLTYGIDMSDEAQVAKSLRDICQRCGTLDVLVNLAGKRLTVDTVMQIARQAGEVMIEQGYGKIINSHSCAKSAREIHNLTKLLADDYVSLGVNVNAVSGDSVVPPTDRSVRVQTVPKIPIHRTVEPSDLVGAFLFLASSGADYITGQSLYIHHWS